MIVTLIFNENSVLNVLDRNTCHPQNDIKTGCVARERGATK